MKSIHFIQMQREEQEEILYRKGVYIGKQRKAEQVAILFQLEGFYVEVHYKEYRQYIDRIKVTSNPDIIDQYLEPFDMGELMIQ